MQYDKNTLIFIEMNWITRRQELKLKKIVDKVIYPFAFAGPVFTLPQIFQIWSQQDASGVSLLTWISWLFIAAVWVIYGIFERDMPIILSNIAWLIVEIGVIAGILVYG